MTYCTGLERCKLVLSIVVPLPGLPIRHSFHLLVQKDLSIELMAAGACRRTRVDACELVDDGLGTAWHLFETTVRT
jgi:hypothetical protein